MALIMVCGKPCVGKSSFSRALQAHLQEHHHVESVIVNIESLGLQRGDAYADPGAEKSTRSALMSETYRQLGAGKTVILDALNLISGYRYQLWCQARETGGGYALVWVDAPPRVSQSWNSARADAYPDSLLAPLASRFEVPTEQDRWDTPLFRVSHRDALVSGEAALDAAHPGAGVSAHVGGAVFSAGGGSTEAPQTPLHADDSAAYATSSGVAPSGSTLDRVRIVAAGDGAGGGWSVVHVGSQVTHMDAPLPNSSDGGSAGGDSLAALSSTGAKSFQLRPQHLLPGGSGPASAAVGGVAPAAAARPLAAVRAKPAGVSAFKRKAAVKPHAMMLQAAVDAADAAAAEAEGGDAGSVGGASSGAASAASSRAGSVQEEPWSPSEASVTHAAASASAAAAEAQAEDEGDVQGWPLRSLRLVAAAAMHKEKLRSSQATQKVRTKNSDMLFLLDSSTAKAARAVCSALAGAVLGSELSAAPATVKVLLTRRTTAAEVQRLRQQFMRLASGRVSSDDLTRGSTEAANANLFVQFLNAALRRAV